MGLSMSESESESHLVESIRVALERGARIRPAVGGFPYLAETLRRAGVERIHCCVPAMATTYVTARGAAIMPGSPLVHDAVALARFDRDALVAALRADQAGHTTYPEFAAAAWRAGVLAYEVDLAARTCTYRSAQGETYVESYAAVEIDDAA